MTLAVAGPASAQIITETLTFDNLHGARTPVPNGYGVLDWNNFYVMPESRLPGTGYEYGNVSLPNDAYAQASIATLTGAHGQSFDFESAYLSKAWHPEVELPARLGPYNTLITGYRGDSVVYRAGFNFTNTQPTFVDFDWHDVTKVTFQQNWETVIDNMTVRTAPEPTAYVVMLLAGAAVVVLAARRSREVGAV